MTKQQHFAFGQTNAKTLLENTASMQNDFRLPVNTLSDLTLDLLLQKPILCHVRKTGKSRLIESDEEMISMLKKATHISPPEYLSLLKALPLNRLEKTKINVIFMKDCDAEMQDHFFHMFFLKQYQKEGVRNGKLDYSKLEASFIESLPQGKRIKDYLSYSRRYSYATYLAISAKTFSTRKEKK